MNKLQQAYIDLGLQPGASLDQVVERWRIIARMWHPDRAATEQERTIAEAELKKVNGARDLLQRHHQDGLHRLVGCECSSEPAVDPRGATYENTSPPPPPRSSNGTNGTKAKTGATSGARTATARRKRQQQSAPPVVASVIAAAMVLLAMSIVKLYSGGVRIDRHSDAFDNNGYAPQQTWRPSQQQYASGMSESTIASLRPSPTRSVETATTTNTTTESEKSEEQATKQPAKEKPKSPELPPNTSIIEFVSGDGRLVSLQDGSTWELWPMEPADSFFHWERGERVTVKGKSTSPSWLVNQSRGNQGVKVTRVE